MRVEPINNNTRSYDISKLYPNMKKSGNEKGAESFRFGSTQKDADDLKLSMMAQKPKIFKIV